MTYLFYKPFNVLSQFSKEHDSHVTLADYLDIEKDVYPIGRLDRDSEGLLLLSNDKSLVNKLLHPSNNKSKTYVVQVEGDLKESDIVPLRSGIELRINKKTFTTKPAGVQLLRQAPEFPPRNPPIRVRISVPTSWVEIKITEGKNRQVRKMFAKIEFPVLRLIRTSIDNYTLEGMKQGEWKVVHA